MNQNKSSTVKCPGCGAKSDRVVLNDLGRCDNCGLPVHLFDKENCKTCIPIGFEPCMGCAGSDYPRTQDEL